ncbi:MULTISPECIES: LysR family transcriptional regulator [unclassified Wenzhouxiangella]|uniref:LysR family transcriptional regulator n=1 Tax=unclassified Wenzhouxiangella TaxID=2613841 RepID=UPI000E329BA7|nr:MULTISPECIES: LysR family transcriptional regulator [unclassified Wenzhouxiangella]RFF27001.1 LysR family transcriptional regulator [Wenzhouxiangella sp. 15181]RFP69513.1 LysR family transcriptional regulator [Wenzhouxiangella sp. 15190]
MDRFQEMQVFSAVVDAGSFVGAANALDLSAAAVSRQLAALESRLGVRLLNRTTRRLSLTEEGEVFLERARELLEQLSEAEAEITERSAEAVGRLRINAPVSFGVQHLSSLWGDFLEQHPRLQLDITLSDRTVDLVEEGYDLAIRIGRLPDSTLIGRRLSTTRMILCASPEYLVQNGSPKHPQELADHAIWSYSYFALGDEWRFTGPDGEVSVRLRPALHSNNGDTCRTGALQHRCIILQPSFLVGADLEAGRLVELLPDYRAGELDIHALYPSRRHIAPKLRLMIDYLANAMESSDWAV